MSDDQKITLTLSGGGFRATLFHLGVIRFLYEAGVLKKVCRIVAVSGGSVLAAHLVLNWDLYTSDSRSFDHAAKDLVDFAGSDVRGRVIRRWLLAWLLIVPRLLKRTHWTFTNLLQLEYKRLYKSAQLKHLSSSGKIPRPKVFFNCTSLSTGSPCSFGCSGFMWHEGDVERPVAAPETQIAFAVAASSAFPPLFPPIAVSHEILSCDRRQFPNPHYLTDGGVYDNLGINRLIWFRNQTRNSDLFLISDAEGNFDWDFDARYSLITSRNIRASDLLMKRVSSLQYESLSQIEHKLAFKIDSELDRPEDCPVLSPEIQRSIRNIRTDLDAFSPNEITCLVQHGYSVARAASISGGLVNSDAPRFSWIPIAGLSTTAPNLAAVRKSSVRRLGLWSSRDWASWASLAAGLALLSAVITPDYLARKRTRDELAQKSALAERLQAEIATFPLRNANACRDFVAEEFKGSARPATNADYDAVARFLDIEPPVIRAVAEIEAGRQAFLDGRPPILFERQLFSRFTHRRYRTTHDDISADTPGGYGPSGRHQYDRLRQAVNLDCPAALAATSWGAFQMLGSDYKNSGFGYVDDFVQAQLNSELDQVFSWARFLQSRGLDAVLKRKDFEDFARLYNGASYQPKNDGERLTQAYQKYRSGN